MRVKKQVVRIPFGAVSMASFIHVAKEKEFIQMLSSHIVDCVTLQTTEFFFWSKQRVFNGTKQSVLIKVERVLYNAIFMVDPMKTIFR